MHRIQQTYDRLTARAAIWFRARRVDAVLSAWTLPDAVTRGVRWFARPRRAIAGSLLLAAVAVPATLYLHERSQRIELEASYRYLSASTGSEIGTLKRSLGTLLAEQTDMRSMLLDAGFAVMSDEHFSLQLIATGYSSTHIETDDTPFITASNTRTRTGIVAMSRDLLTRYTADAPFAFGDTIHISGLGDFIVEDSMHGRWTRRIDIWFPSRDEAFDFGIRKVVVTTRGGDGVMQGDVGFSLASRTLLAQ